MIYCSECNKDITHHKKKVNPDYTFRCIDCNDDKPKGGTQEGGKDGSAFSRDSQTTIAKAEPRLLKENAIWDAAKKKIEGEVDIKKERGEFLGSYKKRVKKAKEYQQKQAEMNPNYNKHRQIVTRIVNGKVVNERKVNKKGAVGKHKKGASIYPVFDDKSDNS